MVTPAMRTTAVLLGVPEMVTPAMRTTAVLLGLQFCSVYDTGNEDNSSFARFFKLDKYAMFKFDKFKIIITLRRAQKFGDTGV